MKRGHGVISHYKFSSVRWINMHNLGCDLNAKYKHTQPPPQPPPSPSLSRSLTCNQQSAMVSCRLLDLPLVSVYLLLLLLGVGGGVK